MVNDIDVLTIDLGALFATAPTLTIDDIFYLQDLKQRKLTLADNITGLYVDPIISHILQFNADDKKAEIPVENRQPILLYISSNGGSVDAGFSLIDTIMTSKTPVYTVNTGCCYSMGFLVFLAGAKRYAFPNAKYLIHDGDEFMYNSSSKLRDQIEFHKQQDEKVKQFLLAHSKITSQEYDNNLRMEWYMFADQAKEKGIVENIIGVDVDIDEII